MKSPRDCSVCDSRDKETIYQRRFTTMSNGLLDGYDVMVCNHCGFCFADNLPSREEFESYYEQQSKYESDYRSLALSEYDTRRLPFSIGIIANWLPDRNARVLDIGCATGGMLGEMKKQGYKNLRGVDPSPGCAHAAQDLFGIEVTTAPVSRIPKELGTFDLVILGSVFEHILDLNGTAERVRQLLNPNGCVYVEVPDITRSSLLNDAPFQEFNVEHINYFSPVSLQNLWTRHGFEPVGVRQTQIEQSPGMIVYEIKAMFRRIENRLVGNFQPDTEGKNSLQNYVLKSQAKLDRLQQVINSLADNQRPIVVWGVGTHTQSLLATTKLKNVNIRAFVDSNTRYVGQKLNGIPILHVSALKKLTEPVLVSSQQFQSEIVQQMKTLGLTNEAITLYE